MFGITRTNIDTAGGGIIRPGSNTIFLINGVPAAVVGSPVEPHPGGGEHIAAVMVQGSSILSVNGVPVVLEGMQASCKHEATGDPKHRCSR